MAKTTDYNPKALEELGLTPKDLEPQDKKQERIDELEAMLDALINGETDNGDA